MIDHGGGPLPHYFTIHTPRFMPLLRTLMSIQSHQPSLFLLLILSRFLILKFVAPNLLHRPPHLDTIAKKYKSSDRHWNLYGCKECGNPEVVGSDHRSLQILNGCHTSNFQRSSYFYFSIDEGSRSRKTELSRDKHYDTRIVMLRYTKSGSIKTQQAWSKALSNSARNLGKSPDNHTHLQPSSAIV